MWVRTVDRVTGCVMMVVVGWRGWGRVLVTSLYSVTVVTSGSSRVVWNAELPCSSLMVLVRKRVSVLTTGVETVTTWGKGSRLSWSCMAGGTLAGCIWLLLTMPSSIGRNDSLFIDS